MQDRKGNIWVGGLDEIRSLSSKNWGVKYLLSAIDVFTKYAWVKLSKDEKANKILNCLIKIINESKRKLNKLLVDQGKKINITLCKNA